MRRAALLLGLLSALTFLAWLGRPAIADSDEAFYAEAAREMLERDDWITPYYNYEYRFQKPILYYWLVGVSYLIGGVNAFTARLPAALSGAGLVLLTFLCARRWYDASTAILAGAIAATNFGYFFMARQALPDLPLAFCITLTTWAALEALAPARTAAGRRAWLALAGAAAGAGFLMKGPVGIALPAIIVLPALSWESHAAPGRLLRALRERLRPLDVLLAIVTFLVVAVPWYAAMVEVHGVAYLHRFFVGENLERFATDRYNEPRPFWFYLPIVAGGLLPWTPFMLLWVPRLAASVRRQRVLSSPERRLLVWALAPVLFYTLSIGKQPRYVLPVLPPLAILLARAIVRDVPNAGEDAQRSVRHPALVLSAGLIAGVLLLVLGLLVYRARPLFAPATAITTALASAIIVSAGSGVMIVTVLRRRALPATLACASVATLLSLQYFVFSRDGAEPVQQIAAAVRANAEPDQPIGTHRLFVRNLIFYTGSPQVDLPEQDDLDRFVARPGPVLVVLGADELEALEARLGRPLRRLMEVRYFNPAGLKPRMLLWPDFEQDLETAVLVTTAFTADPYPGDHPQLAVR